MSTETEPLLSVKHRNNHSVATCQAKIVFGSSSTPHAALLVHPSGITYPAMNLQGQLPVKADLAIFSPVIGMSG